MTRGLAGDIISSWSIRVHPEIHGKRNFMNRSSSSSKTGYVFLIGFLMVFSIQLCHPAMAQILQRVEIPSSPNPVGSGARALGMGGAFIAVADDATAASWNPGGLIQLEKPEVSLVGAVFYRVEDNEFGTDPEASGSQSVTDANINYFSIAYPFTLLNRNMIVSLNYQNLFDFSREWNFPLVQGANGLSLSQNIDYDQNGNLSAVGLAYAIQVTPRLSFGITLNFWEDWGDMNEWEQTTQQQGTGNLMGTDFTFESVSYDRFTFSGFNVNVGVLWGISDKLTLGAVLKTPFTADVNRESTFASSVSLNPPSPPTVYTECLELDMPMSYGIGIAFRSSDRLTISGDIYRTEWQDFVFTDSQGNETSAISGLPVGVSDIDSTIQLRLGAEYLIIRPNYIIPLRGGIFYDPAPAEGSPDNFYGFSLGSGFAKGRFIFDIAYQYRFGRDVGTSILQNLNFSQDVDEHTLYGSIIFHF